VKIKAAIIEILTFNNLSSEVYHFESRRFLKLTLMSASAAHHACETFKMLSRNTPHFISPLQWPPNSPDLKSELGGLCNLERCRSVSTARQSRLYLPGGPGHSEPNGLPCWKIFAIFPVCLRLRFAGVNAENWQHLLQSHAQYVTVDLAIKKSWPL